MVEMTIYGVSFDLVGKQPIVLLKTADGNRYLPIWIGHPEAAAILMRLQGQEPPRPLTHDLVCSIIESLGAEVGASSRHSGVEASDLGVEGRSALHPCRWHG